MGYGRLCGILLRRSAWRAGLLALSVPTLAQPTNLLSGNLLSANNQSVAAPLTGLTITLHSFYPSGLGQQVETWTYRAAGEQLLTRGVWTRRISNAVDSTYFRARLQAVPSAVLLNFWRELTAARPEIKLVVDGQAQTLNLARRAHSPPHEPDVTELSGMCYDCPNYQWHFQLYNATDTVSASYGLSGVGLAEPTLHPPDRVRQAREVLEWLYMYRLLQLTLPKHDITRTYFTNSRLARLVRWVNAPD